MVVILSGRLIPLLTALAFCLVTSGILAQKTPEPKGPSPLAEFFEGDASFTPSVTLNPATLAALAQSSEGQYLTDTHPEHPERFFRAAKIQLHGSGQPDVIVGGLFPLTGADNAWFWLVASPDNHPRVILFAQGSVAVMPHITNGFRDIRTIWCSPNDCTTKSYRYRRHSYVLFKSRNSSNR